MNKQKRFIKTKKQRGVFSIDLKRQVEVLANNQDDARAKDFLSCLGNGKSIFQIEGEEE